MTRQGRWIAVSAGFHALVLVALLRGSHIRIAPIPHPGTREGTHLALVYHPGRSAAATAQAVVEPVETPLSRHLKLKPAPARPSSSASPSPSTAAASSQGNNALGTGNVTVALATYFPWPRPDLAILPHGTRGDVIVDITIDQEGRIVETQVAQSMGQDIDSSVLSTIQTWTFKPATRDGVAVPSEQELLFHFEHA